MNVLLVSTLQSIFFKGAPSPSELTELPKSKAMPLKRGKLVPHEEGNFVRKQQGKKIVMICDMEKYLLINTKFDKLHFLSNFYGDVMIILQ